MSNTLQGEISLTGLHGKLTPEQVDLLQAVAESGSISAAARLLQISYKTAWERIERLNQLSPQALVERVAGGSHGGGSQITPFGKNLVQGYLALEQEHKGFIQKLGEELESLDDLSGFSTSSRLLARLNNRFHGAVEFLSEGDRQSEVVLRMGPGLQLVAVVSTVSARELGIAPGLPLIAMIDPAAAILASGNDIATSARNQLPATVDSIAAQDMGVIVTLNLGINNPLSVQVTRLSATRLNLVPGSAISVLLKASSITLLPAD